ncbi:hypothetical protein [Hymenobacter seoulensis]
MNSALSSAPATKAVSWAVLLPGTFLATLIWAMSFSEWFTIAVIADPKTIASYSFGSEAMVGEGGNHYRSAQSYTASALLGWLLLMAPCIAFILAIIKRTAVRATIAYGLLLFLVCVVLPVLRLL